MDWQERLRREALLARFDDFDLLYHVSVKPAVPPEYAVAGLVGLTFRLRPRPRGGFVFVTVLDLPAAARLGARMGLDPAEAIALVDSHERTHVAMQLAGVAEDVEEEQSHVVDAVLLSLRHPALAKHLEAGDFGLVTRVRPGFFEALIDAGRASD
ncbi:MAG TPA: hypothetical protein VGR28_02705 [Candidatus Thermoplasmatota archaeon]|nr:hypothetical protein [Candidatus Thermoplasmatota archaeon]